MALENIEQHSPPEGRELSQALKELQGLTFSVVNGAGADTNITLTGYSAVQGDTVKSILYFPIADVGDANAVTTVTDLTSELQVGSTDSTIQLSTTATTGGKLLVIWFNKGAL